LSRHPAKHGAVVSNSSDDGAVRATSPPTSRRLRHAANLGNQSFFG
jgi:hypothetical protein